MGPTDPRLDQLLGAGATAFRATFDLVPDPVGVQWAVRDRSGCVVDFEGVYGNPAMARMWGSSIDHFIGRRMLDGGVIDEDAFRRMRGVVDAGTPSVVETVVQAPSGALPQRNIGVFVHRAIPFGPEG